MSTCSPVTLRTTSGPVTKMRPAPLMITMSVSAGPYAAAAGGRAEHDRDLRHPPGGADHRGEDLADRVERDHALGQPGAAGVPQADHRHPLADRGSIASTMCRQPSVPIAPPMRVASVAKAIDRRAVDLARAPLSTPESSVPAMVGAACPRSNSARSRTSGSRKSTVGLVGDVGGGGHDSPPGAGQARG